MLSDHCIWTLRVPFWHLSAGPDGWQWIGFTSHLLPSSLWYHIHSCLFLFEHFLSICVCRVTAVFHIFLSFSLCPPPPPLFNLCLFSFSVCRACPSLPTTSLIFHPYFIFSPLGRIQRRLGHQTCTGRFLGDTATMFVCAPLIQLESNWKQQRDM